MRFLFIISLILSSSLAYSTEVENAEKFFLKYLTNLRQKDFNTTKSMITPTYLKSLGGDSGLKKLIELQDGKKETPQVAMKTTKGRDEVYLISLHDKNKESESSNYKFKVIKTDSQFKLDGTVMIEED